VFVDVGDLIMCFKFGDDRLRGIASAESQILPFRIDFDGRPYNTLTQPRELVIDVWRYIFFLANHDTGIDRLVVEHSVSRRNELSLASPLSYGSTTFSNPWRLVPMDHLQENG